MKRYILCSRHWAGCGTIQERQLGHDRVEGRSAACAVSEDRDSCRSFRHVIVLGPSSYSLIPPIARAGLPSRRLAPPHVRIGPPACAASVASKAPVPRRRRRRVGYELRCVPVSGADDCSPR